TLLRWAIGGLLLSVPFIPSWIATSHQVETATIAFLLVTTAIWRSQAGRTVMRAEKGNLLWLSPLFACAVMAAAVLLPIFPIKPPDPDRTTAVYASALVRVAPKRTLNLIDRRDADLSKSLVYLKKHNADFVSSVTPYIKVGTVYALAYDAKAGRAKILIDDGHLLDLEHRWQNVHATPMAAADVQHVTAASR